jgi:hypothetical protein
MPDVFISYASEDRTRVRSLADALSAHGWSVWWDREIRAGKRFAQVIADALASARCVVVVWSQNSITSDWVREEAEEGRRRGILIPVIIDEARPPLGFGAIQAVELRGWDGSASAEPFQRLIADMAEILGPPSGQDQVRNVPATPREISPNPADAAERRTRIGDAPTSAQSLRQLESPDPSTTQAGGVTGAATGSSGETLRPSRQLRFSANKARWSVVAAGLVVAVLGLYKLITDSDGPTAPGPNVILKLDAVLAAGGKPLERDVRFNVYEAATAADGKRKFITWDMGGPVQFPLSAGHYYVIAGYGSASTDMEVKLAAGDGAMQRTLNLQAGILRLSAVLAAGEKPLERDVRFDVHEAATDADGRRKFGAWDMGGIGRFPVAAGRYHVRAGYGSASSDVDVEVAAGDEAVQRTLNLQAGILRLSAVLATGGKPLERDVRFDVYEAAIDADGKRKFVTRDVGGQVRFPLSAGRYYVTARSGIGTADAEVMISAGQERPLQLGPPKPAK